MILRFGFSNNEGEAVADSECTNDCLRSFVAGLHYWPEFPRRLCREAKAMVYRGGLFPLPLPLRLLPFFSV
jgi:hypothetical protein